MRASGLALRLARREVWRRPGRSALVALLVAVPVAAMVVSTILIHTGSHTPDEEWQRTYGQADAVGQPGMATPDLPLPDGARVVRVIATYVRARSVDGRRSDLDLSDLPLLDPLSAGIHEIADGRAPAAPGEIALARGVARRLQVAVGDDLVLVRPALTSRVVGILEPVGCLDCPYAVLAPGTVPADLAQRYGSRSLDLIDLPPLARSALAPLAGLGLQLRADAGQLSGVDPNVARQVRWSLVLGALALTVVGIVISASFAVGARRQLVTLGQLAANGAPPSVVRASLVLQGTVTGAVGALLGVGIAGATLGVGRGLFERLLDERIHAYVVRTNDVVLAAAIGVVAATVAALLPARTAARVPTLAALAGRRPLAPVSGRLVAAGFAGMAVGLGLLGIAVVGSRGASGSGDLWAAVAILGGVTELLGACAIAPAIVARLEPLAHRLRGSLRLGARSLARNRARTGAVVSAVAASGALAVAAGALVLGGTASNQDGLSLPDDTAIIWQNGFDEQTGAAVLLGLPDAAVLDDLRGALPGASERVVRTTTLRPDPAQPFATQMWTVGPSISTAADPRLDDGRPSFDGIGMSFDRAVVADDQVLSAIDAPDSVRAALDDTGLVVLTPIGNLSVSVTVPGRAEPVPARAVHVQHDLGYLSGVLISERMVERLGLEVAPTALLFESSAPLTAAQRDDLEDIRYTNDGAGAASVALNLVWHFPRRGPTELQVELLLSGVALVFSLFVVGVSLALAAAESKDERDVLTIAGAPPVALARSAGARAWLMAVIGGAMAIPVGFLPVVVFSSTSADSFLGERFPLVFPTRTALLLVLAVPAIVAAASVATSAAAQRLRPVRVSTATFE